MGQWLCDWDLSRISPPVIEIIRKTYDDGGVDSVITTRRLINVLKGFMSSGVMWSSPSMFASTGSMMTPSQCLNNCLISWQFPVPEVTLEGTKSPKRWQSQSTLIHPLNLLPTPPDGYLGYEVDQMSHMWLVCGLCHPPYTYKEGVRTIWGSSRKWWCLSPIHNHGHHHVHRDCVCDLNTCIQAKPVYTYSSCGWITPLKFL